MYKKIYLYHKKQLLLSTAQLEFSEQVCPPSTVISLL